MMRFDLVIGCLVSLAIHAGVVLLAPAPASMVPPPAETPTDTELVALDVPLPPALQPPPPAAQPVGPEAPVTPATPTYDARKIGVPDLKRIEGTIEKMSTGVTAELPLPPLQLPTRQPLETDVAIPLPPLPPDTPAVTAALLEQASQAPGLTTGVDKQTGWGQVRLGDKRQPSRLGLPQIDRQEARRALPPAPSAAVGPQPLPPQLGIEGPVAEREPLYRPPLPEVQVRSEDEITLKFWVRPDGVVSRVIPERKGDAALEAAAIRYLEGWRFTPLPPHEPQIEQWGSLTVRFLRRKR